MSIFYLSSSKYLFIILCFIFKICNFFYEEDSLYCPFESNYVSLFIRGFSRNLNKSPIELIFFLMTNYKKNFIFIVGDSDLGILSFIDLCFIAFLLTSYSL